MNGGGSSSSSRYEPIAPIGTGGMATVFVARTRGAVGFSRLVALKRAHSHVKSDAKLAASMKLEAHLASRLHHANVVSVLDVEEDDGDLVLVLDYVEGCTLRTLASKLEKLGEHRPRELMRIVLDVAAGLHAAHQTTDEHGRLLGLVHRDVSPSNILVGVDGVTRIADFGIAKAIIEGSDRTETGILKGKSSYMAPEYVMHQRASAQSDLFSLGVVAWEALTGERLFKGPNEIETLKRVMAAEAPLLSKKIPRLAPLDGIIGRALARDPSDRYSSVEAMASELEDVARAHDLVATHAEVSALIERVAKVELDERRRLLRADLANAASREQAQEEEAATVVAMSSSLLRAAARDAPPSSSSARIAIPPVSSSHLSSQQSRVSAKHAAQPASTPAKAARTASEVAAAPPPPPLQAAKATPRPAKREASRAREMLALAGAFVLLGIALTVMAVELGTAPPEEEPTPTPSPSPSPSASPSSLAMPSPSSSSAGVADASTSTSNLPDPSSSMGEASSPPSPSSSSSASRHRTTAAPSGLAPKKVTPANPSQTSSAR